METKNYYNEKPKNKENLNNEKDKIKTETQTEISELKEDIENEKMIELLKFFKEIKDFSVLNEIFEENSIKNIETNFENFLIENNLVKNFIWSDKEILNIMEKYLENKNFWNLSEKNFSKNFLENEFFKENKTFLFENLETNLKNQNFSEKINIFLQNANKYQKIEFLYLYNKLRTNTKIIESLPFEKQNFWKELLEKWEYEKFFEFYEKETWNFLNFNEKRKDTDIFFNIVLKYSEKWKEKVKIKDFLPENHYINLFLKEKNLENKDLTVHYFKKINQNDWVMWLNIWKNEAYIFTEDEQEINFAIQNEAMHAFLDSIWFKAEENSFKKESWISNNEIHEFLSDYSSIKISPNEEIKRHLSHYLQILIDPKFDAWWYNYSIKFHWKLIEDLLWKDFFEKNSKIEDLHLLSLKIEWIYQNENIKDPFEEAKKFENEYLKIFEKVKNEIFEKIQNSKINYNWKILNWIDYIMIKNSEKWNEFLKLIYENKNRLEK